MFTLTQLRKRADGSPADIVSSLVLKRAVGARVQLLVCRRSNAFSSSKRVRVLGDRPLIALRDDAVPVILGGRARKLHGVGRAP